MIWVSVAVKPETKKRLDKLIEDKKETYNDIISRLIDFYEKKK